VYSSRVGAGAASKFSSGIHIQIMRLHNMARELSLPEYTSQNNALRSFSSGLQRSKAMAGSKDLAKKNMLKLDEILKRGSS
jgi:hypothetical protein